MAGAEAAGSAEARVARRDGLAVFLGCVDAAVDGSESGEAGLKRRARDDHDCAGVAEIPAAVFLPARILILIALRIEGAMLDRLTVLHQPMRGKFCLHQAAELHRDWKSCRALVAGAARERIGRLDAGPIQRNRGTVRRKLHGARVGLHLLGRRRKSQRSRPASVARGLAESSLGQKRIQQTEAMKRSGDPPVDLRCGVVRSASPRELDVARHDRAVGGVTALAGTLIVCRGTHRL